MFDYPFNLLQIPDIRQRVRAKNQEVGKLTRLDTAIFILLARNPCGIERGGVDQIVRWDEICDFSDVFLPNTNVEAVQRTGLDLVKLVANLKE